jgi:hypothetical protein
VKKLTIAQEKKASEINPFGYLSKKMFGQLKPAPVQPGAVGAPVPSDTTPIGSQAPYNNDSFGFWS